ncbi:MAG: AAA family ATPase, partial [Gammaproteobacteria bacterium]|nr:AAA family ATPase [Gammaproteobacteria bacterium]
MLEQLSIKNYKCFHELHIDHLSKIVLLGGDNNSGKTSFLEAIF